MPTILLFFFLALMRLCTDHSRIKETGRKNTFACFLITQKILKISLCSQVIQKVTENIDIHYTLTKAIAGGIIAKRYYVTFVTSVSELEVTFHVVYEYILLVQFT